MMVVLEGKPVSWKRKSAVPAVMSPVESRVTLNVICTLPKPVFSGLAIAGTSLDGDRLAVITIGRFEAFVGPSSLQPAAPSRHKQRSNTPDRFIVPPAAASAAVPSVWKPP